MRSIIPAHFILRRRKKSLEFFLNINLFIAIIIYHRIIFIFVLNESAQKSMDFKVMSTE